MVMIQPASSLDSNPAKRNHAYKHRHAARPPTSRRRRYPAGESPDSFDRPFRRRVWRQSLAQSYPSKPIRLVLEVGTGGVGDVTMRGSSAMSKSMGQSIVVENRPSARGRGRHGGSERQSRRLYGVAERQWFGDQRIALQAALRRGRISRRYRPRESFSWPWSPPDAGLTTVPELIAFAKKNPRKAQYRQHAVSGREHSSRWRVSMRRSCRSVECSSYLAARQRSRVRSAPRSRPLAPQERQAERWRWAPIGVSRAAGYPHPRESGVPGYNVSSWTGIRARARRVRSSSDFPRGHRDSRPRSPPAAAGDGYRGAGQHAGEPASR